MASGQSLARPEPSRLAVTKTRCDGDLYRQGTGELFLEVVAALRATHANAHAARIELVGALRYYGALKGIAARNEDLAVDVTVSDATAGDKTRVGDTTAAGSKTEKECCE